MSLAAGALLPVEVLRFHPLWGQPDELIRYTLAFPFYLVAFVLHLLCPAFTAMAQRGAGEESYPSEWTEKLTVRDLLHDSIHQLYVLSKTPPETGHTQCLPGARSRQDFYRNRRCGQNQWSACRLVSSPSE
jgi:hypothetical protein